MQITNSLLHGNQLYRALMLCVLLAATVFTAHEAHPSNGYLIAGILDIAQEIPDASAQNRLKKLVRIEQSVLKREDRSSVQKKAEQGERLAQIEHGSTFAREAYSLSFYPAAANDALSDAVRWYSLAARRGFPGAASLDVSGASFYPIRIQRNR